jgi:transglutaminase-like putative cysteine protease
MIVQQRHRALTVHARCVIEVMPFASPAPAATMAWDQATELLAVERAPELLDACQFTFDSPYTVAGPAALAYARSSFAPGRPLLEAALDLTRRIHADFVYDGTATEVATPVDQVLRERRGVCQDFAHLELACLRQLGLPARYVSGYLRTYPPPGGTPLVGADASHAWLAIWCPGHGWLDLDPTNGLLPGDEHVTLAWGRDYGDVSPINGVILGGGEHEVAVAVDVVPLTD